MRATKYDDGVKRIKTKIEVPMCVDDVSNYIIISFTSNVVDLAKIQKLNKRELLQLAKDEVREKGTGQISIETVDNDTKVIVKNYVKQMFPELQ